MILHTRVYIIKQDPTAQYVHVQPEKDTKLTLLIPLLPG